MKLLIVKLNETVSLGYTAWDHVPLLNQYIVDDGVRGTVSYPESMCRIEEVPDHGRDTTY